MEKTRNRQFPMIIEQVVKWTVLTLLLVGTSFFPARGLYYLLKPLVYIILEFISKRVGAYSNEKSWEKFFVQVGNDTKRQFHERTNGIECKRKRP